MQCGYRANVMEKIPHLSRRGLDLRVFETFDGALYTYYYSHAHNQANIPPVVSKWYPRSQGRVYVSAKDAGEKSHALFPGSPRQECKCHFHKNVSCFFFFFNNFFHFSNLHSPFFISCTKRTAPRPRHVNIKFLIAAGSAICPNGDRLHDGFMRA